MSVYKFRRDKYKRVYKPLNYDSNLFSLWSQNGNNWTYYIKE